jgi:peptide/nickel transport system substrate-binding protein
MRGRGDIEELGQAVLTKRISRRTVLRQSLLAGISIPALAGLISACDDDDDTAAVEPEEDDDETEAEQPDDDDDTAEVEDEDEDEDEDEEVVDSEDDEDEVTDSDEPRYGGTIHAAMHGDVRTLNPTATRSGIHSHAWLNFYEPLMRPEGEPLASPDFEPLLAESWDVADDGSSITFNIRQDVKFHDGTDLDAEAVKFNFEWRMDPDTGAVSMGEFSLVESMEVSDDHTLVINFTNADPMFLSAMNPNNAIVSPAAIEEYGEDLGLNAVGTGPFVLESFEPAGQVVGVRNEDYWNPQYPYVDRVIIEGIPENTTRMLALEAGEINVAANVLWEDADEIAALGFEFSLTPPSLATAILMNPNVSPFDEMAVREAVAYGIDRDTIREVIFGDLSLPNDTGLLPQSWGYCDEAAEAARDFDPDRARQLLDDAGWELNEATGVRERDGEQLSFEFPVLAAGYDPLFGEIVQGQLQELGMDAQLNITEISVLYSQLDEGDYALSYIGYVPNSLDPDEILRHFHSEAGSNRFQYSNPEVDALIDEALVTTDQDERAEMYCQIQTILNEEVAAVWMFHVEYYGFGFSPSVNGVEQAFWNVLDPRRFWIAEE